MDDKVKKALEEIKHTLATIGYDDVDEHYKVSCALDSFRDGNVALLIAAAERAERLAVALVGVIAERVTVKPTHMTGLKKH